MKTQKKAIIFAIITVVVVGLAAGAAIYFSNKQNEAAKNQTANDNASTKPQRLPSEEKADEVDKMAGEQGDVTEGAKAYDEAIKNTSDSTEQFVYYSRKATLLYNNKDYNGALDAARKADDIKKTSDSAAFVGQIAREKGDTALALAYYKKALQAIDKADPFWDEDTDYYKSIIAELEA